MNVYLLRHTAVATKGLCYGQQDVDLAASWRKDFARCKAKLPLSARRPALAMSSPSSRCRRLAHYLFNPVAIDARLMELDFGQWEGQAWDGIPENELTPWSHNFVAIAPPGGETFAALVARCSELFTEVRAAGHQDVVLVTHSGVVRALLSRWLQLAPADVFRLQIDFGGLSAATFSGENVTVQFVNR